MSRVSDGPRIQSPQDPSYTRERKNRARIENASQDARSVPSEQTRDDKTLQRATCVAAKWLLKNPPRFAHVHCAQALGIPVHIMFTMPWKATRAFPHSLVKLNATDIEPSTANWLTYGLVELMPWQGTDTSSTT
ncbi:glycosyltransferase family 1 protein [Thermothelomyces thermophilus ATCC 42464]|uniref:Glycosyltransferase family 1 protein n=1 Tax=Thermothelomyces thermophilus (strain ATCC 42464 / BCRC 31852 / DSM 1799) TaxID=573729 RepID=G2Q0R1_THET4|nr:glycosyltransferase family 1 protein [Thermothelomyces thermophilus ATCC 42464]AEO55773.1 glycosyltransferase family 1 protein [Thermothelomyces thermophilus ATCC 42464]